jgi:NagD protein
MAKAYLSDMDGVLIRGNLPIPGAVEFVEKLKAVNAPFLVLTNNSRFTPRDHQARLQAIGLNIEAKHIFTSALATARFLDAQRPHGTAFVIGEAGLTTALHEIGYVLTEHSPDYVVLGETNSYSFEQLTTAIRLIDAGARFIATNPDVVGPTEHGIVLACGAVAAMITAATGVTPYFVGKPNPLMMRSALRAIGAHSENTVMIGDRMDTDILSGLESGLQTILVLTGVTTADAVNRFPYKPSMIVNSIADVIPMVEAD